MSSQKVADVTIIRGNLFSTGTLGRDVIEFYSRMIGNPVIIDGVVVMLTDELTVKLFVIDDKRQPVINVVDYQGKTYSPRVCLGDGHPVFQNLNEDEAEVNRILPPKLVFTVKATSTQEETTMSDTTKKVHTLTVIKQEKKFRGMAAKILEAIQFNWMVHFENEPALVPIPDGSEIAIWDGKGQKRHIVLAVPKGERRARLIYPLELNDQGVVVAKGGGDYNIINATRIYSAIIDFKEEGKSKPEAPQLDLSKLLRAPMEQHGVKETDGKQEELMSGQFRHPLTNDVYSARLSNGEQLGGAFLLAVCAILNPRPLHFPGQYLDIVLLDVPDIGNVVGVLATQEFFQLSDNGGITKLTAEQLEGKQPILLLEAVVTLDKALHVSEEPQRSMLPEVHIARREAPKKEEQSWIPQMNQFVKVHGHPETFIISDYDSVTGEFLLTLADSTRAQRADEVVDLETQQPIIKKKISVPGRALRPLILKY